MLTGSASRTCGCFGPGREDKLPKLSNLRSLANCHCGRQGSRARFPQKIQRRGKTHEELHRHVALAQNEGNTYPADNS